MDWLSLKTGEGRGPQVTVSGCVHRPVRVSPRRHATRGRSERVEITATFLADVTPCTIFLHSL